VKTRAQAQDLTRQQAKSTARTDLTPVGVLFADKTPAACPSVPGHRPVPWPSHCLPPPTDLVITLQHLTI
jgi:hypothetical protein